MPSPRMGGSDQRRRTKERGLQSRILRERGSFRCRSSSRDRKGQRCRESAAAELERPHELRDLPRRIAERGRGRRDLADVLALLFVRDGNVLHGAREGGGTL